MTPCPRNCTFAYWSVVPPTHCPYCGRCLGCGQPPVIPAAPPVYPRPIWWTTPTAQPYTITITNTSSPPDPRELKRHLDATFS